MLPAHTEVLLPQPQLLLLPAPRRSASFLSRAVAYLLDLVAIGVVDFAVNIASLYVYCYVTQQNPAEFYNTNRAQFHGFTAISGFIIYTAYFTLWNWYSNGLSLGKWLCRIQVTVKSGEMSFQRALFRSLAYQLSYLSFSLGFILPILRKDSKSLHDLLTGTEVLEKAA